MRKTLFVALACVLGLLVAEASSAKAQYRPRLNPFVKILKAVEEVGAQVGQGFQLLMGEIGDLGPSQAALLVGQEEVLQGQEAVREEMQKLLDLFREAIVRPDLLLVPVDGQMCRDNGESLTLRVENVGIGDAGESDLVLFEPIPGPVGPVLGDFNFLIPALGPREHFDLVLGFRDLICEFDEECLPELDLKIDEDDRVRESDEMNNLYLGLRCNP